MDHIITFLIALLSGLGVGSGGLLVIYLTLITEMDQLTAQGLNLLFFLFSSGAAFIVNIFKRHIYFDIVGIMIAAGIPGTLFGTLLAHNTDPTIIKKIFGIMLVLSGLIALFQSPSKEKNNENDDRENKYSRK